MEMQRLAIGVLGAGTITQFAHLPALARCRRARGIALCDAAKDLLDRVGDKFSVERRYTDFDAMLEDCEVRAVLIAAPDAFHVPLAIRALRAGKHVLVEKPLGETSVQCRELIAVRDQTGLKVQVGSMKRHDPGVAFAQAFLCQKAGRILSVSGVFRDTIFRPAMQQSCLDPAITSERIIKPAADPKADREHYNLVTQGAHLFDTMRFLGAEVTAVTARVAHHDGNWSWHGIIELAGGGAGHFELTCKACSDWCERYEICGETGSARVEVGLPFYHRPALAACLDGKTQITSGQLGGYSNAYANQLDAFAQVVLEERPTNPSAEDGLAVVLMLEAVEQSVRTGRRVAVEELLQGNA